MHVRAIYFLSRRTLTVRVCMSLHHAPPFMDAHPTPWTIPLHAAPIDRHDIITCGCGHFSRPQNRVDRCSKILKVGKLRARSVIWTKVAINHRHSYIQRTTVSFQRLIQIWYIHHTWRPALHKRYSVSTLFLRHPPYIYYLRSNVPLPWVGTRQGTPQRSFITSALTPFKPILSC